mmetsp:Transcript_36753/g.113695  ORF Transcript_36753/g.113695 Transcript_36753/m.113695 type:complete len:260 (-) Transcript_36753:131-910(-)
MTTYGAAAEDNERTTPRRGLGLVLAAGLIALFGLLGPGATTSVKPAFRAGPPPPGAGDKITAAITAPPKPAEPSSEPVTTAEPSEEPVTSAQPSAGEATKEPSPSVPAPEPTSGGSTAPFNDCDGESGLGICVATTSCPGVDSGKVKFPPEIVFNHPNEKKKDDCGKWDKTFDEACCEGQEFSKHGCNDGCKQNSVDYYVCFLNTLAKDEGSKCTFDASDCTKDSCEKAKKKNKKSDSAASLAVGTAAALAATAAFVAL